MAESVGENPCANIFARAGLKNLSSFVKTSAQITLVSTVTQKCAGSPEEIRRTIF